MSRKPVSPVVNQEGVSIGAPGEPVSGPSTGRLAGASRQFLSTDVVCSYCGAQPGQRCVSRDGLAADISHNVRAVRAQDATKRWRAWHGDKEANLEAPPL